MSEFGFEFFGSCSQGAEFGFVVFNVDEVAVAVGAACGVRAVVAGFGVLSVCLTGHFSWTEIVSPDDLGSKLNWSNVHVIVQDVD